MFLLKLSLNQKVRRGGYVGNAASPYQAAQGVVPNSTSSHEELDTIDSKGMKFSLLFDGDDTSINFTIDRTQQKNIPPFAQLTNTIPNWSAAFGVGASALTGGLKLWPIELFQMKAGKMLLILIPKLLKPLLYLVRVLRLLMI